MLHKKQKKTNDSFFSPPFSSTRQISLTNPLFPPPFPLISFSLLLCECIFRVEERFETACLIWRKEEETKQFVQKHSRAAKEK